MNHSQRIQEYFAQQRPEMVALLADLVAAESPSDAPETQAGPIGILYEQFDRLGYHVRHTPGTRTGGYLIARHPAAGERPTQLLVGHCDTCLLYTSRCV